MKKKMIESYIEFDWIGDHQMTSVTDIADACFAEVGMNAFGGNRLPQWKMGLPLWNKAVLARYLIKKNRMPEVMMVGHHVIGYLFYTVKPKAVMIDQIAVDPDYWRSGYATRMITRLQAEMPGLQRKSIGLKVAEQNLPAQLMLRKNGFRWFQTIKRPGIGQDDYLMRWRSPAG